MANGVVKLHKTNWVVALNIGSYKILGEPNNYKLKSKYLIQILQIKVMV